jgi:peptide/nickel transport system substrate-binding protein
MMRAPGIAIVAIAALTLAGCASTVRAGASDSIVVGTTTAMTALDPAGSFDEGSRLVQAQVFAQLLDSKPGSTTLQPDLAATAGYTSPTEYTVTLKPDLTFANGDRLTSSDVKFSFDRLLKIKDPNGPSELLSNLVATDATTPTTVVFHLTVGNDQRFLRLLSTTAGAIVDEQVFSADHITSDDRIVTSQAFSGQYSIDSYHPADLITFESNPHYAGILGPVASTAVSLKTYSDASNLERDLHDGVVDVAFGGLSTTETSELRTDAAVRAISGPGGEARYIVFDLNSMPYGTGQPDANAQKALAVRAAAADVIDRSAIASQVYDDSYTPLFSVVPDGVTGAVAAFKTPYGDGKGGPDNDSASRRLADAGVTTPVAISLHYTEDHFGVRSVQEYAHVKTQLEATGLFAVTLIPTPYANYPGDRAAGAYAEYQFGAMPGFSDANDYLAPFAAGQLQNHFSDDQLTAEIVAQNIEPDPARRISLIQAAQAQIAAELPVIPLLQSAQLAFARTDVTGVTLDGSLAFRFGTLARN